jgi:hypothetical protein
LLQNHHSTTEGNFMETFVTLTFTGLSPEQAGKLCGAVKALFDVHPANVAYLENGAPVCTDTVTPPTELPDPPGAAQGIEAAAKPKTAKPRASKAKSEPSAEPSIDDVRAVLADVLASKGAEASRGLLAKFGADRLSTLSQGNYGAFVAAARGMLS